MSLLVGPKLACCSRRAASCCAAVGVLAAALAGQLRRRAAFQYRLPWPGSTSSPSKAWLPAPRSTVAPGVLGSTVVLPSVR